MVEHAHGKGGVMSSNLIVGSKLYLRRVGPYGRTRFRYEEYLAILSITKAPQEEPLINHTLCFSPARLASARANFGTLFLLCFSSLNVDHCRLREGNGLIARIDHLVGEF